MIEVAENLLEAEIYMRWSSVDGEVKNVLTRVSPYAH